MNHPVFHPVIPSQRAPVPPTVAGRVSIGTGAPAGLDAITHPFTIRKPVVGTAWALQGLTVKGIAHGTYPVATTVDLQLSLDGSVIDSFLLATGSGGPTDLSTGAVAQHGYQSAFPIYDTSELSLSIDYYDLSQVYFQFYYRLQIAYL